MAERIDADGTWLVQDDGTELLIEPSAGWIAAHPEPDIPDAPLDPIDALRDALAPITPTSNTGTVRTALLNLKAALGQ